MSSGDYLGSTICNYLIIPTLLFPSIYEAECLAIPSLNGANDESSLEEFLIMKTMRVVKKKKT